MGHRFLCPGSKVELIAHANVIPAGTYTFIRRHDELLEFSVTPEISFVLASSYWGHLVRPACTTRKITSQSRFLERYATLLKEQEAVRDSIPEAAISMCFMSRRALNQIAACLTPG